jgi:hypothetical protein
LASYFLISKEKSKNKKPKHHFTGLCNKSINDLLNKKAFCLGVFFLIFSKKNQRKDAQTSFYFAAGGGEMLFTEPRRPFNLQFKFRSFILF